MVQSFQNYLFSKVFVPGFGGAEDMLRVMVKGGYPSFEGCFFLEEMFIGVVNRLVGRAGVLAHCIHYASEFTPMWHMPL